jgi:hypothetical protein
LAGVDETDADGVTPERGREAHMRSGRPARRGEHAAPEPLMTKGTRLGKLAP